MPILRIPLEIVINRTREQNYIDIRIVCENGNYYSIDAATMNDNNLLRKILGNCIMGTLYSMKCDANNIGITEKEKDES